MFLARGAGYAGGLTSFDYSHDDRAVLVEIFLNIYCPQVLDPEGT